MEIKIQYIVNLFMTAAPLIIFAVIFLLTPLPDSKKIGKFSTSLRILSLSYFCLATFCIYRKCEVIDAPFLVTSSIQAYLLAFSHLNMTNPSLLNYKYVLKIISPMSLMTIIYCIIAPFYPHVILTHGSMINPFSPDCAWITSEGIQWEVAIRVIWLICYILNILYLIVIYKKEYDEYQNRLDNFSSEMPLTNFRLINTSFFLIVFIGIDSVFVTFTNGSPTILNIMLNLFMLILYFVGIEVERRFGHLRMLLLYFASGIAGNLLSLAAELRLHEVWRSLGASGAVFGVVAAMAVLAVRNRRYIGRSGMQRVLFGIAFSLYSGFRTAGTNNFAHVGGFLTGVALTCLFLLAEDLRRRHVRRE